MGGVAYGAGRQALLDATIVIVASRGLRGLTYRTVAAEAGVTQGLVRHHFGDWDSLLEEALTYAVERSVRDSSLESDAPGFHEFASRLVSSVVDDPALQAFQFEMALEARRRPERVHVIERVYAAYREAVARELRRNGIDDAELVWLVFAAIDGLVFQQTVFGAKASTAAALESLRAILRQHAEHS